MSRGSTNNTNQEWRWDDDQDGTQYHQNLLARKYICITKKYITLYLILIFSNYLSLFKAATLRFLHTPAHRTLWAKITTLKISQAQFTLLDSSRGNSFRLQLEWNVKMWNMKSFMCCVKLLTQKANVCDPKGSWGYAWYDVWFRGAQNKCTFAAPFLHSLFKPIYEKYTRRCPQYVWVFSSEKKNVTIPPRSPLSPNPARTQSGAIEETKTKTPNVGQRRQVKEGRLADVNVIYKCKYLPLVLHMKVGYLLANMHHGYICWYTIHKCTAHIANIKISL